MSSSPSAKSEKKRKAEDVTEEAGDGAGAMDADAKKAEEKKKKAEEKKKKKAKRPGLDQCRRRVQKELAEISLDPPANISAGPKGDNLCEWVRSSWHMLVLYRCGSVHSLACPLDTCLQVATILGCPDYGSRGLTLPRRCVFPRYRLPGRLSLQTTEGYFPDQNLPLQHQQQWRYLLGHFKGNTSSHLEQVL
jgi:hypothetical protein